MAFPVLIECFLWTSETLVIIIEAHVLAKALFASEFVIAFKAVFIATFTLS